MPNQEVCIENNPLHQQETFAVPGVGKVCLGALLPSAPPQCLRFGAYFDAREMEMSPPAKLDYMTKAMPSIKRIYKNDVEGCCVISSQMHQYGIWSANDIDSGGIVLATDQEVHDQYMRYKAGPGDSGCIITDVLDVTKSQGLIAGGRYYTIDGYVSVDWTNKLEVQVAMYLFGSLKLGIRLPQAWISAPDNGAWDVTNTPIKGGHDVPTGGWAILNDDGVVIATWGGMRTIKWPAFLSKKWIVECYASLAPLWYNSDKLAPSGVDVTTLKEDLAKLGGGTIPPLPDPNPPPVGPPPVIDSFTANPTSIQAGGTSVLSWTMKNVVSASINGNQIPAIQLASGNNVASPTQTKDYVLTAVGAGGTVAVSTARVEVTGTPPLPTGNRADLTGSFDKVTVNGNVVYGR